jgi:hypothetical protein
MDQAGGSPTRLGSGLTILRNERRALARCRPLMHDGAVAVEGEANRRRAFPMSDRALLYTSVIAACVALTVVASVLIVALADQSTESTNRSEVFQPVTGTTRLGDPSGLRTPVERRTNVATRTHAPGLGLSTQGVLLAARQGPGLRKTVLLPPRTASAARSRARSRTRDGRGAATKHGRARGRTRRVRGPRFGRGKAHSGNRDRQLMRMISARADAASRLAFRSSTRAAYHSA